MSLFMNDDEKCKNRRHIFASRHKFMHLHDELYHTPVSKKRKNTFFLKDRDSKSL